MERRFQLEIDSRKASPTDRTVAASISSEYPVKRFDGMEILSHQPGAVDLSRFPLPLIVAHDDRRLNIGLVEKPVLSDGKLRATLRFGSRQEAEEVWRDVQSGIVRYISIGYDTDKSSIQHNEDGSYTVTRWMPYEVSLVSAPADPTVGIGRAYHNNDGATAPRKARTMNLKERLGQAMDKLETLTPSDGAPYFRAAAECDACLRDLGVDVSVANDGLDVVRYYIRSANGPAYRVPDLGDDDHHFTAGEDYSRIYAPDRRGFGEFLVDIKRAMQPGGRRSEKLDALEQRAAGDGLVAFGSPSDGGMLVSPEHVDFIGEAIRTNDVISKCKIYHPEGNSLTIPRLHETSRADGSRQGGIQARWAAELAQYESSAAKFQTVNLTLEKLTALVYCSDEILEDFQTLGQFVSDALSKELLFKLQDGIINGIGAGMPLGILNSGALVSITAETGQAADCLVSENILKMFARFQPSGTPGGCCWLANRNVLPQLYTLTYDIGTGGEMARLYQPGQGPTGIGSMLGYPVIFIEQCPTLGDLGDLLLCDLKAYILLMKRGGPRVDVSVHLKFDYGQSAFRATLRAEGQPLWSEPLTPYKGSDTVSPFVAVAAR